MTAVQENFNKNCGISPQDKWTTKEQLILCSAVATYGSENWLAVSKNVKMVCSLCGGNTIRPSDWFSQKCCALQYEYLLESIDVNNRSTGVSVNETITDLVIRRLKNERIDELKAEIRRDQKEYAKIYTNLKAMQTHQLNDDQLLEMLHEIEKEQETERIEEMKLENQMREREQRKIEMQRNWRSGGGAAIVQKTNSTDTTTVDMDVEEIIGTGKPIFSSVLKINPSNITPQKQQLPQQQESTSPLLSSLLKSPTSANGIITLTTTTTTTSTTTSTNSARAIAPTITTLLTSGSIPNPNQPAITLKNVPPCKSIQVLSRPISGPPTESSSISTPTQTLISPSQSAPTLSMLLEKNKTQNDINIDPANSSSAATLTDVKQNDGNNGNETISTATDSNNEEVPMDIEEDIQMSVEKDSKLESNNAVDSDEPDPNEEQQLLEVFKNIGNIDELDIDVADVIDDEEADFLKGVDEEIDTTEELDFETKIDIDVTTEIQNNENNMTKNQIESVQPTDTDMKEKISIEKVVSSDDKEITKTVIINESATNDKNLNVSDDDSNDNIPLAEVVNQESKEFNITEVAKEIHIKKEDSEISVQNNVEESGKSLKTDENEEAFTPNNNLNNYLVSSKVNNNEKSICDEDDKADVKVKLTTNIDANEKVEKKESEENEVTKKETADVKINILDSDTNLSTIESENNETTNTIQLHEQTKNEPDPNTKTTRTISIADTDDDSCTTDVSSNNQKEEKFFTISKLTAPSQRRTIHDISIRNEIKTDEESISTVTTIPTVKPPTLRKLRDRDRSESPMIDDETTTASDHSTTQRSRRRYSSTPVIDSIPNSPASSDRDEHRETRSSKKLLLSIYNALLHNKNATVFQRSFFDGQKTQYEEICRRPMDFPTIKKNIDTGNIRTVVELQRDILLMCQNALMTFKFNSENYKTVYSFMQECQLIREFITNPHIRERQSEKDAKDIREGKTNTNIKIRASSRKSQRFS